MIPASANIFERGRVRLFDCSGRHLSTFELRADGEADHHEVLTFILTPRPVPLL